MSLRDKVNFDHIRYANVWEDAGRLLDALAVLPGKRMASIASAGDNVFALLVKDPEVILAFDINPVQLYLCQLKAAAIRTLTREEVIGFLGFTSCENRLELFGRLEEHLSPEALEYWRYNSGQIRSGIIHQGK